MRVAFPVHALAKAHLAQQCDRTGFQHAGADAPEHVSPALPFQHNGVDTAAVQNMRQQQTGRAAADDRDLGACRHSSITKRPFAAIGKRLWRQAATPPRGLHRRPNAAISRTVGARGAAAIGLRSSLLPHNGTFEVSMFETFKTFISDFVDGEKHPSQFADNDYRLAAAALLVHAAAIDGEMSQPERDKLRSVIKQRFALDDHAADELIAKATEAEHESVDLYHFTRQLNRSLDEPGRARVI